MFHRLLALIFLIAWVSLGSQVGLLIGSHGLLPLEPFVHAIHGSGLGFGRFPTLFLYGASDAAIHAGVWLGAALSLLALAGVRPRLCALASVVLYLSYTVACRSFLGFQWDNLLLECGALAVFLPRDRPARVIHLVFRLLLFKLYFESGLAKLQSPIHDWLNGSAMTFYYETAPLPAPLAWYAYHLPTWWHHLESRGTLCLELGGAFAVLGPRKVRLGAAVAFTVFQVVNIATANYGFFAYLAIALHVFLLTDRDIARAWASVRAIARHARRRLATDALRRLWARGRLARRRWVRLASAPRVLL